GNGGSIILGTTASGAGPVNLPSGTLSADGGATGGGGGTISIAGSDLIFSGSLELSADDAGSESGQITVTTTGASSDLSINSGNGVLQAVTNSGTVSVTAGRNLTV